MDDVYDRWSFEDDFYNDFGDEVYDRWSFQDDIYNDFGDGVEDHEIYSDDEDDDEFESLPPVPALEEQEHELQAPPLAALSTTAKSLDEAVGAALPDALVDRILTLLPPATFARLRCVCKRWNSLPSSPGWLLQDDAIARRPSCTVMSKRYRTAAAFFCHAEQKWFGVPPLGLNHEEDEGLQWSLVDIDWGLFCYMCWNEADSWLCVSNPLTKAKTVLPPALVDGFSPGVFLKLVADRQSKTYKVVVLVDSRKPPSTLVYDSSTARWAVLESYPSDLDGTGRCILWKRTIFMRCALPGILQAFDLDNGAWREVEIELSGQLWTEHYFISRVDRLIVIRVNPNARVREKSISVLSLRGDSPSPFPLFKGNLWAEMEVKLPAYLKDVVAIAQSLTSQSECLIFTAFDTNQWVTYNLRTRLWREMPSWGQRCESYQWYDWEPRWDLGTGADPSSISTAAA